MSPGPLGVALWEMRFRKPAQENADVTIIAVSNKVLRL
jgi:hypothetical protein